MPQLKALHWSMRRLGHYGFVLVHLNLCPLETEYDSSLDVPDLGLTL